MTRNVLDTTIPVSSVLVVSCKHALEEGAPIRCAGRAKDRNGNSVYMLICDAPEHPAESGAVACSCCIEKLDPTLALLPELEVEQSAVRDGPGSPWRLEQRNSA